MISKKTLNTVNSSSFASIELLMKRSYHIFLIICFAFVSQNATSGETPCPSNMAFKEWSNNLLQTSAFDLAEVNEKIRTLQAESHDSGNCSCEEYAVCLGLQLRLFSNPDLRSYMAHCPVTLPELEFVLGTLAYDDGNYEDALAKFEKAMQSGVDPLPCLRNMAAIAMELGKHEKARNYLLAAMDIGVEAHPQKLSLFLTMTELNMVHGHYQTALGWTAEIAEKIEAMKGQNYPPLAQSLIAGADLQNRFNVYRCHLGLRDSAAVKSTWLDIGWGAEALDPVLQLAAIHQTAELLKSSTVIEHLAGAIEALFQRTSSDFNPKLGYLNLVAPEMMDSTFRQYRTMEVWDWAHEASATIHQQKDNSQSAEPMEESMFFLRMRDIGPWLLIGISFIAFAMSLFTYRKQQKVLATNTQQNLQIVRNYLDNRGNDKLTVLRALKSLDTIQQGQTKRRIERYSDRLTAAEVEILRLMKSNLPPKEIARLKGWSPGHVYNLTSQIRSKLKIDPNQHLSDWLKNM